MTELTRPERAAQIRQAKRYRAAIRKQGLCCACVHRKSEEFWGVTRWSCAGKKDLRQAPECMDDGRQPKFEFDASVLKQFADA